MRLAIIGGGVIGVSSAWYLAQAGHEVTVIERQPELARETSYANGGQISVSHSDPWATPVNLLNALRWLGREDAPLLFRPQWDPQQWRWALKFLWECWPGRVDKNTHEMVGLALHSRQTLQQLRADLGLAYDASSCGILHLYSNEKSYRHGLKHALQLRRYGCEREELSRDECIRLEPALASQARRVVGGTFTAGDEVGDARLYTLALAEKARAAGVVFRLNAEVSGFERKADGSLAALQLNEEGNVSILQADAFVLAAGSYSTLLARQLGLYLPVYPAKGYSITVPIPEGGLAPQVSLIDDEFRIVFSRLGQRLRVAGTAEFTGYNLDLNAARGQVLVEHAKTWFPDVDTSGDVEHWAGLRPATPCNVPLIGQSAIPNLYLNTGHGTLGWTMAAGSGQLIADVIHRGLADWRQVLPI